jgi:hypothetical protein
MVDALVLGTSILYVGVRVSLSAFFTKALSKVW